VVRAALEAMAYQTRDVVDAMASAAGAPLQMLRADGGASANGFLMQFQADLLGVPVDRPKVIETTAAGAAFLAGLGVGFWRSQAELAQARRRDKRFAPKMPAEAREALYAGWRTAVARVRTAPA
jgi:glycerol kinase